MKNGIVQKDHQSEFPNPIIVKQNDKVALIKKGSVGSGWIYCETENGIKGWVPESYITIENETGIFLKDYDATELTVTKGEKLKLFYSESGWYWCERQDGATGWIPVENIEAL